MTPRFSILLALVTVLTSLFEPAKFGLSARVVAAEFFIQNGDRVVFLGDSITEQRLYTTYVEAYALTRHPDWALTFRNVGWGGDTSWLRQRAHPDEKALFAAEEDAQQKMVEDAVGRGLERDVLPLKPTVVTVKFGMNDHSYQKFRPDIFGAYTRSQAQIAKVLSGAGARVAFLTPQPIEDKRPDPDQDTRNQSLRKFSDGLKSVAEKAHAVFVDQFDPYMSILLRERAGSPTNLIGGGDAVHPGPIGQTVMAWAVLKGLGATAPVSLVELDAKSAKVTSAQNCRIEQLEVNGGTVRFDRADLALPMPIDERADAALKLAPILNDLSRYELRVTGLIRGNYELSIDGQSVGKFGSEELAAGVNLSNQAGPITQQARQVLRLIFRKNDLFFERWRSVQLYNFPKWVQGGDVEGSRSRELARLDQLVANTEAEIEVGRKPKPHRFELKPAEATK